MVSVLLAATLSRFVLFFCRGRDQNQTRAHLISGAIQSARLGTRRSAASPSSGRSSETTLQGVSHSAVISLDDFNVFLKGQFVVSDVGSYEVRPSLVRILATEDVAPVCPLEEKRLRAAAT